MRSMEGQISPPSISILAPGLLWLEIGENTPHPLGFGSHHGANVDLGGSLGGDHVVAGAALNDADVYRRTRAFAVGVVVQPEDELESSSMALTPPFRSRPAGAGLPVTRTR